MDQPSKDESLMILSELEQTLSMLKEALQIAQDNSAKLDKDLNDSLSKLANSELLLKEARQNLKTSEGNLEKAKNSLEQAKKALNDSERSFKAYQQSELLRIIGASVAAFAIGVLTGWGLSAML